MDRLKQFQQILKAKGLDGFIATNQTNIFYLCGFRGISPSEREAILIFHPAKPWRSGATLITAQLYQNEAKKLASKDLRVKIVKERNHILLFAENQFKNAKKVGLPADLSAEDLSKVEARAEVGFEQNNLTFGEYQELKKALKNTPSRTLLNVSTKLIPFRSLIEDLRTIKTKDEIKKIEKAQIFSQKAFGQLLKTLKFGQTEEEIAEKLSSIVKSLGGQGLAFESIIASGPNAGRPHHFTGNRRLTINDILLVDFGAKYQNYCADLSRTIFVGKADDLHKNIFYHVLKAQKIAIDKITHGLKSSELYHATNNTFKKQKLEKYFIHSLGHGIGLQVHEKPHLRPRSTQPTQAGLVTASQARLEPEEEILRENMVFSVEPGLYFPWGGVRIEDLVVIKNGKAKVLGKLSENIIEI